MSTPTERDHQIAILAAYGTPNKEIARQVGVHYNTVARVLQRPEIQDFIAELRRETQALVIEKVAKTLAERMDDAAEDAFEALTGLVRGATSETVQLKAAESVLDRSTVAPKREIHSRSTIEEERRETHIFFTLEDIRQLKQGLVNPDELEGLIDVTPARIPLRPINEVLEELDAAEKRLLEAEEAAER